MRQGSAFLLPVLLKLALIGTSCGFAPPLRVPGMSLGMRQEVLRCGASARQNLRLAQAPAIMAVVEQPLLDEVVQQLRTLVPLFTGLGAFFMWGVQPNFEKVLKEKLDKNNEELNKKLDKNSEELKEVKGELNKKLDKNNEELNKKLDKINEELNKKLEKLDTKLDRWTLSVFEKQAGHGASPKEEERGN